MEFSRQEYWSGLTFPSPGDLSNSGIEPTSPILAEGFLTTEPPGRPTKNFSQIWSCLQCNSLGKKDLNKTQAHQSFDLCHYPRPKPPWPHACVCPVYLFIGKEGRSCCFALSCFLLATLSCLGIQMVAVRPVHPRLPTSELSLEFHPAETWVSLAFFRGLQVIFVPIFLYFLLVSFSKPDHFSRRSGMKLSEIQPTRDQCDSTSKLHRENWRDLLIIYALKYIVDNPCRREFWITVVAPP